MIPPNSTGNSSIKARIPVVPYVVTRQNDSIMHWSHTSCDLMKLQAQSLPWYFCTIVRAIVIPMDLTLWWIGLTVPYNKIRCFLL